MARELRSGRRRTAGLGARLTPRGRAVIRALAEARRSAPGFVAGCGILPEVSEPATDALHTIVRDVSERHLGGRRHMQALQRRLRRCLGSSERDRLERSLTAVLGAEATAAYLFGLSVGLAIHALPQRLADGR